jgi:hypothetical protein
MIELGCADRSRVPNPNSWGHYFKHDPRIMAVSDRIGFTSRRFQPLPIASDVTADARIF